MWNYSTKIHNISVNLEYTDAFKTTNVKNSQDTCTYIYYQQKCWTVRTPLHLLIISLSDKQTEGSPKNKTSILSSLYLLCFNCIPLLGAWNFHKKHETTLNFHTSGHTKNAPAQQNMHVVHLKQIPATICSKLCFKMSNLYTSIFTHFKYICTNIPISPKHTSFGKHTDLMFWRKHFSIV